MSIYDRDFSGIRAKAVAAGSQAQCENVLQACLDEIDRLRNALRMVALAEFDDASTKQSIGQFARSVVPPTE